LREKIRKIPLGALYYIHYFTAIYEGKTTQNTSTYTRKKLFTKHSNSLFFLFISLHFLSLKLFHCPQLRTHTRATQAPTAETKNQRRDRVSSLPLCGGATAHQASQRVQLSTST